MTYLTQASFPWRDRGRELREPSLLPVTMRQHQVASPEGAPVIVSRRGAVKSNRKEEPTGDEKLADCLKLVNRRVLVKIQGNRLKVTTSSQQGKSSNDLAHKVPEGSQIRVEEQTQKSVVTVQVPKRPSSDGVGLPQWGQRKRLRFNNRVDVKAAAEDIATDLKASPRTGRGAVKVEKSPGVPTVKIKRPAGVFKPSPSVELATGDSKRDAEGTGTTCTALSINNNINNIIESGAYTARTAKVQLEQPQVSPENVTITPASSPAGTLPVVTAKTEDNVHQDKTDEVEKVDMDFFQWPKFLVSLSRKEKEDDFLAIKGTKLPVRPKKRSKLMDKAISFISPGGWLCDITRERYEVKEKKTIKKVSHDFMLCFV